MKQLTKRDVEAFHKALEAVDKNTPTAEALELSIRKWELIDAGMIEDLAHVNCALCKRFYNRNKAPGHSCDGCTVQAQTGRPCCGGTPYAFWQVTPDGAKMEITFLKSLRKEAATDET